MLSFESLHVLTECGGHGLSRKVMAERTEGRRESPEKESPEKISFQGERMVVWTKVLGKSKFTVN